MTQRSKATILPGDDNPGRKDNFQYIERYPVVGSVAFQTDVVRRLYEKWRRDGARVDAWNVDNLDSDVEFRPNYYMVRVLGDGSFLYQRNGREVRRLVGGYQKGETFSYTDQKQEARTLARYFQEVVDDRLCYRCCGELVTAEGRKSFESLDCPLMDEHGTVVATIGALALTEVDAGR
ncbi:hypothetical protein [Aestuariispira insulae]|uniref:PAS domain-containing protein n=1 Tax=Aestuariispira insulae TaxID=1461337 RepID=A0A3D9HGL6_9PROT|nr:hypothetical protein [Aestuariispira insulae]RED48629.1 hypothetical protein DFP90_107133 [Aestuariispira insulae]